MPEEQTVFAFDFGTVRLGTAQGSTALRIAHPIATITIANRKQRFVLISALLQEWQPHLLVVGVPTFEPGHDIARLARKFATQLHTRFHLPVALVDERLSSATANSLLTDLGIPKLKKKRILDQVAAMQILKTFFEGEEKVEWL